jgi:cytoskeletal protein CcmA (bactofilin family)
MSEQKRRLFEAVSVTPTFFGAESVFIGNIRGAGHFVVSGEVHGDGELQGGLNLSVTGSWTGFIQAQQAIVAGKITGGLIVKDKLEIGYTAVIRGKVSARTIAIARGAIVDGEIEVTSDSPLLQFEEKRDSKA